MDAKGATKVLGCGPDCKMSGGRTTKMSIGPSTSLGHSDNMGEVIGSNKSDSYNPSKTRPIKAGCKTPFVKIGVGARQRAKEGLKKNKKKKAGSTKHNFAFSSKASKQKEDAPKIVKVGRRLAKHKLHGTIRGGMARTMAMEEGGKWW
ncbi:hypothetical protein Ancab_007636 [Ancistrocladus abbreviatus]